MAKNGNGNHVKFKNETEALAWASFAAGVANDPECGDMDDDEIEEMLSVAAKLADKMLVEHFRKRQ